MAKKKTKKQLKKEVESQYIASTLDITYAVPAGLVHLLSSLGGSSVNEVWCILSKLANVCAVRLSNSQVKNGSSWTKKIFPNTECELRIDMDKRTMKIYDSISRSYHYDDKQTYHARFKINGLKTQYFTQAQVNDYITETILLGDDQDEHEALP